ncbi:MAG: hypothetical protein AB7G75_24680 [Candidatus Binatia bacterium]
MLCLILTVAVMLSATEVGAWCALVPADKVGSEAEAEKEIRTDFIDMNEFPPPFTCHAVIHPGDGRRYFACEDEAGQCDKRLRSEKKGNVVVSNWCYLRRADQIEGEDAVSKEIATNPQLSGKYQCTIRPHPGDGNHAYYMCEHVAGYCDQVIAENIKKAKRGYKQRDAAVPSLQAKWDVEGLSPSSTKSNFDSFGDGTKAVGSDIKPGTYRTRVRAPGCYWARLAGFSGDLGDIRANGNESGPMIVTIKDSDAGFKSHKCGTWTTDLSAITTALDAPFGDGVYLVGTDIAPGTWRTNSPESCYWARLRGFTNSLGDIISSAILEEIVTIAETDKGFRSTQCGTWTKVR